MIKTYLTFLGIFMVLVGLGLILVTTEQVINSGLKTIDILILTLLSLGYILLCTSVIKTIFEMYKEGVIKND